MARRPAKPEGDNELNRVVRRLPSDQIARVMEFYVTRIVQVMCEHTDIGLDIAARCLGFIVKNRRKITSVDREIAITALTYGMLYPKYLPVIFRSLRIEQSIVFSSLTSERLLAIPEPAARHLDALISDFEAFRSAVIRRYEPLAIKQTSAFVWAKRNSGIIIEYDATLNNFQLAVAKAVDRFDVNSGTLTSYVGMWLKNAWSSYFNLSLGESYAVSRSVRTKIARKEVNLNNHAVDLDHAAGVIDDSEDTNTTHILDTIEAEDFGGFLRYAQRSGLLNSVFAPMALAALYPMLRPDPSILGLQPAR